MNKKQAGIIVTLLALIVCAGILAAKVNGPLEVATNDLSTLTLNKDNSKSAKTDYFVEARLTREQQNASTIQTFRSIIDDKNVSQAQRDDVTKKMSEKVTVSDKEQTIERTLKGKGFEDVICFIEDGQVRVIVKAKDVNQQQRKQIQDTVASITKINNVAIEFRQ